MSESEDPELKTLFQEFQSEFGESSNKFNKYNNESTKNNQSRNARNKFMASYKEDDVSGDELINSANHSVDAVTSAQFNNKDGSKSLQKDFDLFCENLSDTSVNGTCFTIGN
jgi:hypothetical protein